MPRGAPRWGTAPSALGVPSTLPPAKPLRAASPATLARPLRQGGQWRSPPAPLAWLGATPPTPAPGSALIALGALGPARALPSARPARWAATCPTCGPTAPLLLPACPALQGPPPAPLAPPPPSSAWPCPLPAQWAPSPPLQPCSWALPVWHWPAHRRWCLLLALHQAAAPAWAAARAARARPRCRGGLAPARPAAQPLASFALASPQCHW